MTTSSEFEDKPDETLEKLLSADDNDKDIVNDILNKNETKAEKNDDDSSSSSDKKINTTKDADELLLKATTHKEEGNTFFQNNDYEKAARSYRRGVSSLKPLNQNNNGDIQVKSLLLTLQTNMSMVFFKQEKYKQSAEMASNALCIDQCHVKALYRRAVANRKLGNVDSAREDLKNALGYEPGNKQIRRELVLIKQELETLKEKEKKALQAAFSNSKSNSFLYQDKEDEIRKKQEEKAKKKQREKEALEKRKQEWEDENVHKLANGEEAISFEDWEKQRKEKEKKEREEKRKKEAERKQTFKPTTTSNNFSDSSDSELDEKELASLRGYKKTSDGKTTSYFTRELSHTEKQLIGDTAPKKIDSLITNTTTTLNQSAWNAAQTWEERDTTDWCTTSLTNHLKNTAIPSSLQQYNAKITNVDSVTGHSSYAFVSGRKRYIFDFNATVSFSITKSDTVIASGSFVLPDISSGVEDHHYEIEMKWDVKPDGEVLNSFEEFFDMLRGSVRSFVLDFNSNF